MIFKRESVEALFALDEDTKLHCIAENIEAAKRMAEEYSGMPLVLTGKIIRLGRKDCGTVFITNNIRLAKKRTAKKCRVIVHKKKA